MAIWCEELTLSKRPWCWERLKAGKEGDGRGWNGWMASPTQWTWVWVYFGSWDGQGGLAFCSTWVANIWTQLSNWTELIFLTDIISFLKVILNWGSFNMCILKKHFSWRSKIDMLFHSWCYRKKTTIISNFTMKYMLWNRKYFNWINWKFIV